MDTVQTIITEETYDADGNLIKTIITTSGNNENLSKAQEKYEINKFKLKEWQNKINYKQTDYYKTLEWAKSLSFFKNEKCYAGANEYCIIISYNNGEWGFTFNPDTLELTEVLGW